ncbi:MAG TPA: YciI family protein [Candidatus Binataceae bacterium]|jgi:hypothetical protein|nr:YciI family protein [Candidatus Binataceae bacterium]
MLFVIIGHDGPHGAALRPTVRPAHLENLQPLVDAGRVVVGGPFTDGSGSLMVVDFENADAAKAFADTDPYVTQGVFDRVEIKPFRKVVP